MSSPAGAWLSAAELAGLPGMPGSAYRCRLWLERHGVPSRPRAGRNGGGGREFDAAALPQATRTALMLSGPAQATAAPVAATSAPAALPAFDLAAPAPASGTPGTALALAGQEPPTRQQAECADARALLVRHLQNIAPAAGGTTAAAAELVRLLAAGTAETTLLAAAARANVRRRQVQGPGVALSARTLFEWLGAYTSKGWPGLLPARAQRRDITEASTPVATVLRRYASTRGSARVLSDVVKAVWRELGEPAHTWQPLYHQVRRALQKVDNVALIKARHTGAGRDAKLPFHRRSTADLQPFDVGVIDGHSFKAKVLHRDHGQPFTPEVTVVLDVATKMITGWSIAYSESCIAVGDAVRHSVGQYGVHAIYYTDNGPGQANKHFDCDVTGLYARIGAEHKTGRPARPQGHGIIERQWRTTMIKCARQFATYAGSDADTGTYKRIKREVDKGTRALKSMAAGTGELVADAKVVRLHQLCPSWRQFYDAVAAEVARYNTEHRHRKLPRHASGPLKGKHYTPLEAMQAWLRPEDLVRFDAPTLRSVFMPSQMRKAERGEVVLFGAYYQHEALMRTGVDGTRVRVAYDIHDPSTVHVWTVDGHWVCAAGLDATAQPYFPKSEVERARERRVAATVRLRQGQIDTALRELSSTHEAEPSTPALPAPTPLALVPTLPATPAQPELARHLQPASPPPAEAQAEPRERFFASPSERYQWLMQHRATWSATDQAWIEAYAASPAYDALAEYYETRGLEWPGRGDAPAFERAG